MACYFTDNVHTKSFTPREYQIELLDAGRERNIIVCLNPGANRTFVSLKLLLELSVDIRRPWKCGGKRSIYIGNKSSVQYYTELIKQLTDLHVGDYCHLSQNINYELHQVLAVTTDVIAEWISAGKVAWSRINLLIIEDCHNAVKNHPLRDVVLNLKESENNLRVLGLTSPLFTSCQVEPGSVEAQIKQLEKDLCSKVETASDIVSILRFNAHTKEVLLECENHQQCELSELLAAEIHDLQEFLIDHRYDPTEIYEDNFVEELKDIPDPKKDPFEIIDDFLEVLNTMGPWCADKAALVLLVQIEKLKVKTPYERHFLLLCLVSSALLKIRAICDNVFQDLSETEKIYKYSSPKVLRLIEVVRQFKPSKPIESEPRTDSAENQLVSKDDCDNTSKDALTVSCENKECDNTFASEQSNDCIIPVESINVGGLNDFYNKNNAVEEVSQLNYKNNINCLSKSSTSPIPCFICGKHNCSGYSDNDVNKNNDSSSNKISSDEQDNCLRKTSDLIAVENGNSFNQHIMQKFHDISNKNNSDLCYNSFDAEENHTNGIEKFPSSSEIYNNQIIDQVPNPVNEGIVSKIGRWRGRGRGWRQRRGAGGNQGKMFKHQISDDVDNLCGIIFVENRFTAKILYHLFHDLHKNDPDFENISTQYTVGKIADPVADPREAEIEHRKQEDVLKRFRMRECNLVIATSVLEEGIELPKCNLIVRYDLVSNYKSHAYSKGRAKHQFSYYISIIEQNMIEKCLKIYAQYICTEKLLLRRSGNLEATDQEELEANAYNNAIPAFKPLENGPSVDMASSITLVNRYCAKLPSDTFTRLTPTWSIGEVMFEEMLMYYCTIRLPINSPLKQDIVGHPMPSKVLSRRIAALETCRLLHERGELDDNLEPIGKEAFNSGFEEEDLSPILWDPNLPRPGTTKSRQYYYKRIANCLNNCRPVAGVDCFLYNIDMVLTCPLPEEQNTRGRKLHPPELAPQAFGILTLKEIPKVCPFPIFTRSGEVQVSLKLCSSSINLTERHVETIATFLNFIFTSVLRLQKYLMSFDPQAKENSFFIVPTRKNDNGISQVDWDFLEVIYKRKDESPHLISDEERKDFAFDPERYNDAVVMPWYRNQDQPRYFYVAEICYHLNPKSGFPGSFYKTFEDYYLKKYGIQIQNTSQPLLDVDHTSARLNFLTPRYVNRKGVALPASSEETKRAKRENLEQKQILVGELCEVHVVPASLWRQAVCLPCILYRLNALLLADEIRTKVAKEIGLGLTSLTKDFEWKPLDFGWSLADVLKKTKQEVENKETSIEKEITNKDEDLEVNNELLNDNEKKIVTKKEEESDAEDSDDETNKDSSNEEDGKDKGDWMEIGTWSNEMAQLGDEFQKELPPELSMVRYGSPTSWNVGENQSFNYYSSDCESDDSSEIYLESETSDSSDGGAGKLKITFRGDYLAEAIEENEPEPKKENNISKKLDLELWTWETDDLISDVKEAIHTETEEFEKQTEKQIELIKSQKKLIKKEDQFIINKEEGKKQESVVGEMKDFDFKVRSYNMPPDILPESPKKKSLPYIYPAEPYNNEETEDNITFSFDHQPELEGHPGPSPSILLQALTMSNANDGINLERLETIGDSFLKYAITTYLYCTHENIHEGKLSHLRSKQVSNLKLYRLGQKKVFGESMIASKFEPHDNWLPPCYLVPRDAEQRLLDSEPQATLPYNLVTQHSIPDKSIADCVEALIGAYLIECGPRGALLFMSWLGIKVLPKEEINTTIESTLVKRVGSLKTDESIVVNFTSLSEPVSPLLRHVNDPEGELAFLMAGFETLESSLHYSFRDKSYLLQAMSHASYSPNRVTDCYQRLEFLGDAVLDYLITRHLFEDKRAHSPGALTDLRSALVNNTIFAYLAVKYGLHKYFRHLSPGLAEVIQRFVTIQEENSHLISEEYYLVGEEAEDVEVPKALGDVFESVAGAIFLDSGMSLDTVWKVYYRMMKKEIEQFSTKVPKSPIRELLELEPETAKFSKPEKLADGRRVRVTVEVFGKGTFKGIGRNYRIAKCTAAKCALKQLKIGLLARKLTEHPSQSLLKVLRVCHDLKNKH